MYMQEILDAIKTTAEYHGLEMLDDLTMGLPDGACIKLVVYPLNQIQLFLMKAGVLIGRMNDVAVQFSRPTWKSDLISKVYLLKTLYQSATTCKTCGKPMRIYKQTDPDRKHYGDYYARCDAKRIGTDKHTLTWIELVTA